MTKVYIAAEPISTWVDQNGIPHDSREEAIASDLTEALSEAVTTPRFTGIVDGPLWLKEVLKFMATEHPDMLRILIGDRDET